MKHLIMVGMLLAAGNTYNLFDGNGKYLGQIDSKGNILDNRGAYQGQITPKGDILGPRGEYEGTIQQDTPDVIIAPDPAPSTKGWFK